MMADEDDYMSDIFVKEGIDTTPGLINSRSIKRSYEMEKKKAILDEENRKRNLPVSEIESKRRNLGLNEPICNDNKGFELLTKMGFEPGKGLGKTGSGRVDPLDLELKTDRQGLGRETQLLENLELTKKGRAQLVEGFRARLKEKSDDRQAFSDLSNSQRICRQLDMAHGLTQPDETWYWPEEKPTKEDEEEEQVDDDDDDDDDTKEELSVDEKLRQVTEYLREVYFYCLWCGVEYSGEFNLANDCPGDSRDQH